MIYVQKVVNSSCNINVNINVFFLKVFYRQTTLYTFAHFTSGLQRKTKGRRHAERKKYTKSTEEMHMK